ncbi:mCG148428 [Mus musculus]|nr:mCG148428 [Mus musculus]
MKLVPQSVSQPWRCGVSTALQRSRVSACLQSVCKVFAYRLPQEGHHFGVGREGGMTTTFTHSEGGDRWRPSTDHCCTAVQLGKDLSGTTPTLPMGDKRT